ncbi:uncharacterized protein LOC124662121 [Lolium rigidum]|uniref:uncharacterized protein LOC124662121 n=1 Tax=Lolium rigidum TaxID=89674 RepID=UPI001F5DE9C7|nr:uncharacterized protein LOC124662121 [Lolium rigidum]
MVTISGTRPQVPLVIAVGAIHAQLGFIRMDFSIRAFQSADFLILCRDMVVCNHLVVAGQVASPLCILNLAPCALRRCRSWVGNATADAPPLEAAAAGIPAGMGSPALPLVPVVAVVGSDVYIDGIDDAPRKLLDLLLRLEYDRKAKSFFLAGWFGEGVGASAVLRATVELLKSGRSHPDTTQHFGKVIHVDYSLCKNRRDMQRAIAKELNLGHLMPIFDNQDEEDDFEGIAVSSRKEIESIGSEIYAITIHPDNVNTEQLLNHLLKKEAAEVIDYTGIDNINPSIVLDCFLYSLFLVEKGGRNRSNIDYEWDTHACNYWICDGILHGDKACDVGSALHSVIQMVPNLAAITFQMSVFHPHTERYKQWISVSSNEQISQDASSYFLSFEGDGQPQLKNDIFQLANNLRVLKLCKSNFDFTSPPFRCCHNLRFLWLDHCTNTGEDQGGGPFFPNMLVLDIRFTDFPLLPETIEVMINLREVNTKGVSWRTLNYAWKKLQNLHKLRVTESSDVINVDNCSSIDMMNLELLDLSGNIHMESLPTMSSAGNLKMLVLDGCSSLEHVALEGAPPLLESFSFDGYGPAKRWTHPIQLPKVELRPKSRTHLVQEAKVRRISLKGCTRLRNIFLRALPNLEEVDLSNTAVRELDLGKMDVPEIKKLFLLGCAISLRDCWALRRLPAVSRQGPKVVVDCEKDWWDMLEWDDSDANHDPSLFETRHPAHYKKTLPRVSVLR